MSLFFVILNQTCSTAITLRFQTSDWDTLCALFLSRGSSTKPVCCFSLSVVPSPSFCFESWLPVLPLSSFFLLLCFVLSRCRRYQNRYSHSAETTSLFSWLTCSTTSHLSMAAAGSALGLKLCSPPALWISLVFSLQGCVCIWGLNGEGVIEKEACLESGNS